jgi:anti-sigma factor RsiW
MNTPLISENDLHAFADGQLEARRCAELEACLAAEPGAAAQLRQIRAQNQALRQHFDGVLEEPVPARLSAQLQQPRWPHGIAAAIAWLGCGVLLGWFGHLLVPVTPPLAQSGFVRDALAAHMLYTAEQRHPVEVPATQEAHLVAWLSKRLAAPIRAPDLQVQGFTLLGGRLLPGQQAPLAQLMYESAAAERLTLTVRHAAQPTADTGFKVLEQSGTSVFYWIDRDYGYALSGTIGKARLLEVAQAVERQLRP